MTAILLNDRPKADPKSLAEAMERINDGEYQTFGRYMQTWLKEKVKFWSWYLSENEFDGKKMAPINPKLWPMMACVFENQLAVSPRRNGKSVEDIIFESTTRGDVAWPVRVSLPMVRDVFPLLFMNRICGLQPMPPQSGGTMNIYYRAIYRTDTDGGQVRVTTTDSPYADSREGAVPKRLNYKIASSSVTATAKKLAAVWSQEVEEDLAGAHGVDLPREMMDECAQEILREYEAAILNKIYLGATAGTVTWSWTKPDSYVGSSHRDYYETLYHGFIDAAKLIRANRHQDAQFIVCGINVAAYMQKTNWFTADPGNVTDGPISSGVTMEGRLGKKWDVFSTPYLDEDASFMSYYPIGMLHAGHIWCPYIPLMPMPRIYGEMKAHDDDDMPGAIVNTDQWTQNVRTRNGDKLVQPDMFARVNIQEDLIGE